MKINFLKNGWFLIVMFAFVPVAAQNPSPTPLTNTIIISKSSAKEPNTFLTVLETRLSVSGLTLEKFCPQDNIVTKRILKDYGAVFVGNGQYSSPCYFKDEKSVQDFQSKLGFSTQIIDGARIELQSSAMDALLKAIADAKSQGLSLTPRGGSIAGGRSFSATVTLWNSRILPGLNYWVKEGKITAAQGQQIRGMEIFNQIVEILQLEEKGIYFSKDFSKSILYSVAAPGTSQHNLMLAFDVEQYSNPKVRRILADHGWFQTVATDLPHFTYLGVSESQLPLLGLHSINVGSQVFWIPQMETAR